MKQFLKEQGGKESVDYAKKIEKAKQLCGLFNSISFGNKKDSMKSKILLK
jgi:hypothetical protein